MTRVIAEIGVNHMGSRSLAERLVHIASAAGCWGVKFQFYIPELLDARKSVQANLREWVLPIAAFRELRSVTAGLGLAFGASCFDNPSVGLLESLEPDFQKTACGQAWPGMRRLPCLQIQSYLHTDTPDPGITPLVCVPKYPCSPFDYLPIPRWAMGISDHVGNGTGFPEGARGLEYAEVHVMNLDSQTPPDVAVSLSADELKRYVRIANEPVDRGQPVVRHQVNLEVPVAGQSVAWLRGVK